MNPHAYFVEIPTVCRCIHLQIIVMYYLLKDGVHLLLYCTVQRKNRIGFPSSQSPYELLRKTVVTIPLPVYFIQNDFTLSETYPSEFVTVELMFYGNLHTTLPNAKSTYFRSAYVTADKILSV